MVFWSWTICSSFLILERIETNKMNPSTAQAYCLEATPKLQQHKDGAPLEPGSSEELKRHRVEFREVLVARTFRVDYGRRRSSTETRLQRAAEGFPWIFGGVLICAGITRSSYRKAKQNTKATSQATPNTYNMQNFLSQQWG